MEKLIITVAGDSRTSYPAQQPIARTQEDIARLRAAIRRCRQGRAPRSAHIHGRRTLEESIAGRRQDGVDVSIMPTGRRCTDMITEQGRSRSCSTAWPPPASRRRSKLMKLGPDMMAVAFNAHDEYFQPVPSLAAQANDGDPSGRGTDRLCQGRRGAQGQARMRVLPDRRVLASRFRAQGRLPEEARPTSRCSSAGRAAPGCRRPSAPCSSSSTTCRPT